MQSRTYVVSCRTRVVKGDWEVTGQAPYYATRVGMFEPMESLEAARAYLTSRTTASYGEELPAQ